MYFNNKLLVFLGRKTQILQNEKQASKLCHLFEWYCALNSCLLIPKAYSIYRKCQFSQPKS